MKLDAGTLHEKQKKTYDLQKKNCKNAEMVLIAIFSNRKAYCICINSFRIYNRNQNLPEFREINT